MKIHCPSCKYRDLSESEFPCSLCSIIDDDPDNPFFMWEYSEQESEAEINHE